MNGKTGNGNNKLVPILVVLVVILIAAVAVLLMKGRSQAGSPSVETEAISAEQPKEKPSLDAAAGEYQETEAETKGEAPGIAIPGWGSITLPANTTTAKGCVDFYNPDANAGWYYLTFEIRIPDEKGGYETIYQSGLIEPGKHIQSIELIRPLEAGEYDAVIHVQPYSLDEELNELNNADMKTVLKVG